MNYASIWAARCGVRIDHDEDGLVLMLPAVQHQKGAATSLHGLSRAIHSGCVGHQKPAVPVGRIGAHQEDTRIFVRNLKVTFFKIGMLDLGPIRKAAQG